MRSPHRAWRWLLALFIGLALLQPSFGAPVATGAAHCSDMAATADTAPHDPGSADRGCCMPGGCAGACVAVAPGDMALPPAAACGLRPAHTPPVAIDRALAPETPPPIG